MVLCPGSRNAPLAFALQDADRSGRIRLHVRIDERTAGYLAIGLAIAAGAPVCVAMTSGTAVANLGPAVIEANYARVPLIVLSANRPYELLGTGANQTMEQLGYFGTQVRATISLGLAEDAPERLDSLNATWRSATCRVLVAATGSRTANAGPVHFDIPLREPLVPDPEPQAATPQGRPGGRPWTYTPPVSFDQPLDIDLSPDTVVIAGHGAGAQPNLAQLPTVAEPTAPAPANPLHPLALPLLRPKQVIMLGRPTLHRPVSALAGRPAGAGVRAHHRAALAGRLGQFAGHRHPGGHHRHTASGVAAPLCGDNRHALAGRPQPARGAPADHRPACRRGRGRCAGARSTSWCSGPPTRSATRRWSAWTPTASGSGPTAASPASTARSPPPSGRLSPMTRGRPGRAAGAAPSR